MLRWLLERKPVKVFVIIILLEPHVTTEYLKNVVFLVFVFGSQFPPDKIV